MKRWRSLFTWAAGLTALAAFALVTVLFLGGCGRPGAAPAVAPIPTPPRPLAATAYPIAPTPTAVPTPRPYLSPTPTAVPTWPPTPTPFVAGLKILWFEAAMQDAAQISPTLWMADVGNLPGRTPLYTIAQGQSTFRPELARVSLSPDGSKIAFITRPRPGGRPVLEGILWTMNVDGSELRQIAQRMDALGGAWWDDYPFWSPDSRQLVYLRQVLKYPTATSKSESPDWPEIHVISADGSGDRALVADDTIEVVVPIGWTLQGQVLYHFMRPGRGDELWMVDATTGVRTFITLMHTELAGVHPAPDYQKLIVNTPPGELIYLSVDGRERRTIDLRGAKGEFIWLPSSDEIIIGSPGYWSVGYKVINLHDGSVRDLPVASYVRETWERALSLSPDKQWLAVQVEGAGLNLLRVNSQTRIRVSSPGSFYRFVGWLTQRP